MLRVAVLRVPPLDDPPLPTLGPQVCSFLAERAVFGPGSLKGQPAKLDDETRALFYRAYEVYPRGHPRAGRRRFKRVVWSMRKGSAKTEKLAWAVYAELHPEGPVRCDGFDAYGNPVGRPVRDPYIPLLSYTEQQVEELAYGALYVIVTEGPDADLFDSGLDRIIRLDGRGRADGKAVPLAGSPSARDGARTTMQAFDEPHRMTLPKQRDAHETMLANMPKRPMEDPWALYATTAGHPGQGSIAEDLHAEAEAIVRGEVDRPRLCYFHREAGPGHDMSTREGRIAAVKEATSPAVAEFSDFEDIADQWDRPKADKRYLVRVWTNRWTSSEAHAYDPVRYPTLGRLGASIPHGALITGGFDGARFRDATALVLTDVATGLQELALLIERPFEAPEDWEVDPTEVTEVLERVMDRFVVWKIYADPPHYVETVGGWAGRWPDQVVEWWTNRRRPMAEAVRAYQEAIRSGSVTHNGDPDLIRHVGNCGRVETNLRDEDTGEKLVILGKLHPTRLFDAGMAATLSWTARLDALRAGATVPEETFVPRRIR